MALDINEEKYTYTPVAKVKGAIPIWWCFPSTYPIGMSSLGYLHLFRILDEIEYVYPERIFTDTEKTVHNPKSVEIMGYSFSFELDFLGVFKTLRKYDIPFSSKDRNENHPLIFGGGPVLSANPEPYAEFFDFINIGEGEESLVELVSTYREIRHLSRKEKLIRLAQIPGIYVPSFYDIRYNPDNAIKAFTPNRENIPCKVKKACIKNLSECIGSPILSPKAFFPNSFLVETARGCPKRCRFCLASYLSLPARYPDLKSILETIDKGLEYSNKLGLLGALITEHPQFDKICDYILEKRQEKEFEVSVSSLRADGITPKVIDMLVKCGQRQVTIAVEAGSQRLRNFINKQLSDDDILDSVEVIVNNGISSLKIYAIIGLPTETEEDITQLIELMSKLKKAHKSLKLTLSISSFVPKAHTPFQWDKRESENVLQKRMDRLRKELSKAGVAFKPTSLKWDFIQTVLSRGDRRLAPLIERVYSHNGSLGSWGRSCKELKKDYEIPELDWYVTRQINYNEVLPWDFIDMGLSKETLKKENEKAYKG
jgi:radical SAM superfamily enzyme YgiQ (UPF0313 family)